MRHILKLVDFMCKYKVNLASIVEDTEQTRFGLETGGRTDGQSGTSILPLLAGSKFESSSVCKCLGIRQVWRTDGQVNSHVPSKSAGGDSPKKK